MNFLKGLGELGIIGLLVGLWVWVEGRIHKGGQP